MTALAVIAGLAVVGMAFCCAQLATAVRSSSHAANEAHAQARADRADLLRAVMVLSGEPTATAYARATAAEGASDRLAEAVSSAASFRDRRRAAMDARDPAPDADGEPLVGMGG